MKLGIKIFCCIMLFFSVVYLVGGYLLLSFFYEKTMDREIKAAMEQYQYNKFVVQSVLLTKSRQDYDGYSDEQQISELMIEDMSGTNAIYSLKGKELCNQFGGETDIWNVASKAKPDKVNCRFMKIKNRMCIITAGIAACDDAGVYLVNGVDVEGELELQQQLRNIFWVVYSVVIAIGLCLSFGLTILFTRPIRILTEGTERIADGDYGEQICTRRQDEIGRLAQNFNKMSVAIEEKVGELSEIAKQREDFVANFAHELKTPLTSIIGYANRIYQRNLQGEEQKQAAWYIWNEGMRMEALARKLMDLILFNRQNFMLEQIKISEFFEELVRDAMYFMGERGVDIECDIKDTWVKADCDLLKSLFYNLFDNAAKADAKHITVKGDRMKDRKLYRIEVADDGKGIPPGEIKRITEAFYMVDKARSRNQHGAGLGLALSQRIAEIHGSTLEFFSNQMQGTRVCFCLSCGEEIDE